MSAGTDSCGSGVPETDFRRYMVGETDDRCYMVSWCFRRYMVREANVLDVVWRGQLAVSPGTDACRSGDMGREPALGRCTVRGACCECGDGFLPLWCA